MNSMILLNLWTFKPVNAAKGWRPQCLSLPQLLLTAVIDRQQWQKTKQWIQILSFQKKVASYKHKMQLISSKSEAQNLDTVKVTSLTLAFFTTYTVWVKTRSQAVAKIADRTASQQTLVPN